MYQLRLNFKLTEPFLPKEIERLIVSFLKAAAQKEGQKFFNSMFDKTKSIAKTFCFCCYLPHPEFCEDKILLGAPNFSVFFSDADLEELFQFYNGFLKLKNEPYPMKGNAMELNYVSMKKMKEIEDDTVVIKMLSPLVVREHNADTNQDRYLLYSDTDFSEMLKKNMETQLKKWGIPLSTEGFSITPIKAKKVVIPNFGQKLDANLGVFKLTGKPELLNFLYQTGLGSRRNEGRGKWEMFF